VIPGVRMSDWTPTPLPEEKPRQEPKKRHYVAAHLNGGMPFGSLQHKDQELKKDAVATRRNSRLLVNNNPFMRRYVRTLGGQVVGAKGVTLQSKAPGPYQSRIEAGWQDFLRRGNFTVCGRFSGPQALRLFLRTMAVDGEVFVRRVWGRGKYGFAIQFLDADLLDVGFNRPAGGGLNAIVMGIELDAFGAPVAYWFSDPAQASTLYSRAQKIRIPASEVFHGYDPERPLQTRGMPWTASAMFLLDMLCHYWEAEVSAARQESERPGFLSSEFDQLDEDGAPLRNGLPLADPADAAAQVPGDIRWHGLPAGYKPIIPDVQHPTTAFAEFSKAMLKGIASGMGISYAALASDLTEVSFSSIRQGTQDDREYYRELQQDQLCAFLDWVFEPWFDAAQLTGRLALPAGYGYERLFDHAWCPRGWESVDPKADGTARDTALKNRTTSRTRILAEQGIDFQDVLAELVAEEEALKGAGMVPTVAAPKSAPKAGEEESSDKEDADGDA
jgi:lambda family phage portal protein